VCLPLASYLILLVRLEAHAVLERIAQSALCDPRLLIFSAPPGVLRPRFIGAAGFRSAFCSLPLCLSTCRRGELWPRILLAPCSDFGALRKHQTWDCRLHFGLHS
jgi:hypothetical protein